jgi:hypothetical protein
MCPFFCLPKLSLALGSSSSQQQLTTTIPQQSSNQSSNSPTNLTDCLAYNISARTIQKTLLLCCSETVAEETCLFAELLLSNGCFRQLIAGFPQWQPEFEPQSNQVGFVVDKVALGQVFSTYLVSPANHSLHPLLHNLTTYHPQLVQ